MPPIWPTFFTPGMILLSISILFVYVGKLYTSQWTVQRSFDFLSNDSFILHGVDIELLITTNFACSTGGDPEVNLSDFCRDS